jgi:hypothetical protein
MASRWLPSPPRATRSAPMAWALPTRYALGADGAAAGCHRRHALRARRRWRGRCAPVWETADALVLCSSPLAPRANTVLPAPQLLLCAKLRRASSKTKNLPDTRIPLYGYSFTAPVMLQVSTLRASNAAAAPPISERGRLGTAHMRLVSAEQRPTLMSTFPEAWAASPLSHTQQRHPHGKRRYASRYGVS